MPPAGPFCANRRFQRGMRGTLGLQGLAFRRQGRCFADGVGEGQEVVGARLLGACGHGQPEHFPAARYGE